MSSIGSIAASAVRTRRRGDFTRSFAVALLLFATSCSDSSSGGARGTVDRATLPQSPFRLHNLGKLHADRDSEEGFVEAARAFGKLVRLEPDVADHRLNYAKVLLFCGRAAECARELEEAAQRFGGDTKPLDLVYVLGLAQKRLEKHNEARSNFTDVTERAPKHVFAWFQRGRTEEALEDFSAAEKSYHSLLNLEPEHRSALYRLAFVLQRLGRQAEATTVMDRFRALPKSVAQDHEKCELTAVTLRPLERAGAEPTAVEIAWTKSTDRFIKSATSKELQWICPLPETQSEPAGLLLVTDAGVQVTSLATETRIATEDTLQTIQGRDIRDVVIADFNNDKVSDALLVSASGLKLIEGPLGSSPGTIAGEATPKSLTNEEAVSAVAFDFDHDGDLDVVALSSGTTVQAIALRNNGDGTFLRLTPFADLVPPKRTKASPMFSIDAHDVDQANDLDFVFACGEAGIQAFLNKRDGSFARVALTELGRHTKVLVEDLNNDGAPDFFATGGAPGWSYAFNADRLGSPYHLRIGNVVSQTDPRCGSVEDACLDDVDLDGDLDVLLATERGLVLLRNTRGGTLVEEDALELTGARRVDVTDLDGDGKREVIVGGASLAVVESRPSQAYTSWTIVPEGGRDNFNAIGTVVEQFCERLYQSRMIKSANGVRFGIGPHQRHELDGARLRWPQGIIQAIPSKNLTQDMHRSGVFRCQQKVGLVASCPFLYAYGPEGWTFLTDVLGIAPLDEWLPPGVASARDPEEFVRVAGDALSTQDGTLRFAVTEELREIAYLDRVELIVVDHPDDRTAWIDESTRQPPYGPLDLSIVPSRMATVELQNGSDAEQQSAIAERDQRYLHPYPDAPTQWGGWVESYDLDFRLTSDATAILLTGRLAWYDSTVVYALSQHGRGWRMPHLVRVGPDGSTHPLTPEIGLLAGMDRTLVVPFSERLSAGTRLRFSGQHRFLWDRIASVGEVSRVKLEEPTGEVPFTRGALRYQTYPVLQATLKFHGFSSIAGKRSRHEQTYDYTNAAPDDAYPPAEGRATRYGEVTELLQQHDDLVAVLVCGDAVEIAFEAPSPPQTGASRTYFLRISGWAKEGSFHNRTGRWIAPCRCAQ